MNTQRWEAWTLQWCASLELFTILSREYACLLWLLSLLGDFFWGFFIHHSRLQLPSEHLYHSWALLALSLLRFLDLLIVLPVL